MRAVSVPVGATLPTARRTGPSAECHEKQPRQAGSTHTSLIRAAGDKDVHDLVGELWVCGVELRTRRGAAATPAVTAAA
ncbi:hypothetical protein WDA79_14650 [Streptomyces sp. A475]|uniref:hypothetical protein n=1 Tax=Streptomyces sp. A475 TaxID=3131976 RepID=UPI0030CA0683